MAKDPTLRAVPLRTPMFDGPDFAKNNGNLNRTWIIFFEKMFGGGPASATDAANPARPNNIRTLLLKDTTVGNDIADHVPIWVAGTAVRVIGVLRKAITADLNVRINLQGKPLLTLIIPRATPIDTPILSTAFLTATFADLQVLSWDVTASDGKKDANGVASLTVQFA